MRTNRQKQEHQGNLTVAETRLANRMKKHPWFFTSLDICRELGCVSARDKMRKFKAHGIPIGDAHLMDITASGTRAYGWRIK